jgi:hypothetical protein
MAEPEPFVSQDVAIVRPNPWLTAGFVALLAFGLAALPLGIALRQPALAVAGWPFAFMGGLVGTLFSVLRKPLARRERGELVADARGVSQGGRLVLARADLRAGFVVPRAGEPPRVQLERRLAPPLEIAVKDAAEGRRLLRALGLDASQTTASFRLPSRAITETKTSFALALLLPAAAGVSAVIGRAMGSGSMPLAAIVGLLGFTLLALWPTRVVVGADGVLVTWLGRARFIPYDEVEDVAVHQAEVFAFGFRRWSGVRIHLRSGELVELAVTSQVALEGPRTRMLAERIREGLEGYRHGDPVADAALLARADLPVAEWLRALRALGAGARADHRTAPMVPERLWRLVEDPSAPAAARAGAAVVLAASDDAEAPARLRVAAAAIAAPKVRVAIEAAAGGDEAAMVEALAELDAAPARREAR